MALYDSILDTVGRTPIVRLHRIAPPHVALYAKVESFNPGGSVKDRLALAIILDAERRGVLKPGDTIVEATSGNTGVALAMVAAARGYKFVATMVETFSVERRKLMRAYGAKVILTPAAERGSGMVRKARELAEEHGWFLASQFANPANPAYHRNTTAAEILREHLFSMFPKLPRDIPPSRIKTWFGHRPSMPDGRPCIGHASATRDVVYAFGHGHVGLVGSARTGRLVAQLLSGQPPEIPLAPFAPARFL